MNIKHVPVILAIIFCIVLAGCDTLLSKTPSPTSAAVQMFGVNTNAPNLVAYLNAADSLNSAVNATATEQPVHMLLAGLSTVAAAAAGWYARHKGNAADVAASVAAVDQNKKA